MPVSRAANIGGKVVNCCRIWPVAHAITPRLASLNESPLKPQVSPQTQNNIPHVKPPVKKNMLIIT